MKRPTLADLHAIVFDHATTAGPPPSGGYAYARLVCHWLSAVDAMREDRRAPEAWLWSAVVRPWLHSLAGKAGVIQSMASPR